MSNGYGQLSGDDSAAKKKKVALIGVSSLILVAMVVAVAVGVNGGNGAKSEAGKPAAAGGGQLSTSTKSIEAICKPTDYQKSCVDAMKTAAGNTTDVRKLITVAFNVTATQIGEAIKRSDTVQTLARDPRSGQALQNCRELMEYAINDIKRSMDRFSDFDFTQMDDLLLDLKVWLSAAVTYQETCFEGFENTTGDAGKHMRDALKLSGELTSNALAIVDDASNLLGEYLNVPGTTRRLLADNDDFPSWVSGARRSLLTATPSTLKPNVVVAQDGTGKYKSISDALKDVPQKNTQPFVIYVKAGIYKEYVLIERGMDHVVLIGDGPTKTKITGNRNFIDGLTTFKTGTVSVVANYFIAKDIGIENSAGAQKHQAVAMMSKSDMSIYYNCQFDGYQDTLYAHSGRQFYRDCTISGTIDFIFGDAASIFQNCKMVVRKPLDNQQCIVAAQGRKRICESGAIILQGCHITADPELEAVKTRFKSYLGRPWKEYSRTVIMQTQIDDIIHPDGWLPWMGTFGLKTCFYAEYQNKGPGSSLAQRVKWQGIKKLDAQKAAGYTPGRFVRGNTWIPKSGVPFTSGMMSS